MPDLPEVGEIVVCKITKILDYGVFTELSEYNSIQGFVHISQVSSSWVKNIRNFVKENQLRAAQVLNIDTQKNQIDLSFNKVSAGLQRAKIEEWKQAKRSQKLIEVLAKQNNTSFDAAWKEVAEPLLEKYETLYDAFQGVLLEKEPALSGIDKKWVKPLVELVEKNIEVPTKTVKGVLTLSSSAYNGVELIKSALMQAQSVSKDAEIDIYYVGSGKYMVKVSSFDYKVAERVLKQVGETAIDSIKAAKGFGDLSRMN
ncbi:MAG: translation initiation factor 2 subunit 1 [archaeon GW2011_AR10]|uniref:Translation initiation factor IF-2 subunit alpha n=1 Tax=Candidatus Iainarchaeum sp. TaxID=3101447 RepID=A0A7J4IUS1_9ARCH|nr:MAG: translation initiation factor 2 subunit 1 [archaeon GW2011_AR10]HIH08099.1 translation initiation factor IF-2 subunit alpha [Candidatus Diapherotrites archaeon]